MNKKTQGHWLAEFLKTIFFALVVVTGVHTTFYKPFHIPSPSMVPTLLVGDYLFVNKFIYGFSRYSLPFSPPLFEGRIFARPLKRGDIGVFRFPGDAHEDWIKRVIGLPGDRIKVEKGIVSINGEALKIKKINDTYAWRDQFGQSYTSSLYIETLPNGIEHYILKTKPFGEAKLDEFPEHIVPQGHYFMMGDNRDFSNDSRNLRQVGFISYDHFIGRADLIFFSTEIPTIPGSGWWSFWQWPTATRYSRLFTVLR